MIKKFSCELKLTTKKRSNERDYAITEDEVIIHVVAHLERLRNIAEQTFNQRQHFNRIAFKNIFA